MKQTYFQILKPLIQIPSPSGNEEELAKYIVKHYNKDGWKSQKDEVHNILFRPVGDDKTEKLPLLYAHLDTSPRNQPPDASLKHEDIIRLDETGQVAKRDNIDIQMGFDDKAGVAAILYLMAHTDLKFRALFVTQEEYTDQGGSYDREGGGGIDYAIKNSLGWVFSKSAYVLSLDRKNGHEIIDIYGKERSEVRPKKRLCNMPFRDKIIEYSRLVGLKTMTIGIGSIADVYNIRRAFQNLNCVNVSIGYYKEHTAAELLLIDETLGVIRVVIKCLEDGLPVG